MPKQNNSPESFRGDFGALAAMMKLSWAENSNQALVYTEEFLRSAFEYPGSSFDLAPSIYGDAGVIGFMAAFPRSFSWEGCPVRIALNTFLTASNAMKGKGLSLKLWASLVERCRDAGFVGTINFCVEGDDMNRIMPGLSRFLKLNTQRVFSVEFLVRMLRPVPPEPPPQISEEDIDLFLELASALPNSLLLARRWTRAEAEWQCRGRAGAITVSSRVGRLGILTGYLAKAASTPPYTVVLLEDLFWGDLEPAERTELLERFLHVAAAQGARFASCPSLGYASTDTLTAGRFRRSKRVLHAYLTFWNGLQPRPTPGLYADIL